MYHPTIGLEIHAELKTKSKMFCGCKNDPHTEIPNTHICPTCMAFPGTLPCMNKQAIKNILYVGKALQGKQVVDTKFDRKHYFYPDIPKAYQISQYDAPFISGGSLKGVDIERVHLEEDTARSNHETVDGATLVDFNRAGVPLMELVTKPVISSALQAKAFAVELQSLLRLLGISDARMERGEMRIEANISVSKDTTLGSKVEVKNLNSFKSVERAIEYEIQRQSEQLEKGERVIQETRGWDENRDRTFSQRTKETAKDYRYFEDPDMPPLKLDEVEDFKNIVLPELLDEKRKKYIAFGIREKDVEILLDNKDIRELFEEIIEEIKDTKQLSLVVNYLITDIAPLLKEGKRHITARNIIDCVLRYNDNTLSSSGAKQVIQHIAEYGGEVDAVIKEKGLEQISNTDALESIIKDIIQEHREVVEEYNNGKETSLQFLIGQGMKKTKGAANPTQLASLFKKHIKQQ